MLKLRNVVLLFFFLGIFTDINNPLVEKGEYPNSLTWKDGKYIFYWKLFSQNERPSIEVAIVGETNYWIACAFNPDANNPMKNLDIYWSYQRENGTVDVLDLWATDKDRPNDDTTQGGSYDVLKLNGGRNDTFLHTKFQRYLDTKDSKDTKLEGNSTEIVLCFADSDTKHQECFRAKNINIFEGGNFVFKKPIILPDFHYGVLGLLIIATILLGILQHNFLPCLKYTIAAPPKNKFISFFIYHFVTLSIYEIIVGFLFLLTTGAWLVFYIFQFYAPFANKDLVFKDYIIIACKVSAQINVLNFTFVLLPVSKNSIWNYILGIPFDQAVRYHRLISRYSYLTMTLHGIFEVTQSILGPDTYIFYVQVTSVNRGIIFCGFAAWCFFTAVFIFSDQIIRRKFWEIFQYSHLLVYVGMAFACVHDYFVACHLAFGLIFHIIDLMIRSFQLLFPVGIYEQNVVNDIVHLELSKSGFKFKPGQYVYLWIPEISHFQFHPFSITNYPSGDDRLVLNIKNMGKGTWTDSLHSLVKRNQRFTIRIHGPYGNVNTSGKVHVLCAGGIGVTPMASILGHLLHNEKQVEKVYFIWNTRQRSEISLISNLLSGVEKHKVDLIVNVTNPNSEKVSLINDTEVQNFNFNIGVGRTDFKEFFEIVQKNHDEKIYVYACGPEEMVDDVHRCIQYNPKFYLHKETFFM